MYLHPRTDRPGESSRPCFFPAITGEQLTRAGNEYRWKRHDSLTVRETNGTGTARARAAAPLNFVIEFFRQELHRSRGTSHRRKGSRTARRTDLAPRPFPTSGYHPQNSDNRTARNYLTAARRIDEDVTGFFFARGDNLRGRKPTTTPYLWGGTRDGIPRYAHSKGTAGNFRLDVKGSDKAFNFCYLGRGRQAFCL